MSTVFTLNADELKHRAAELHAGDRVLLSGGIYTARDAAHRRLSDLLDAGAPLPFDLDGAVIYYAGPTPAPPGRPVGSIGPTTSSRMDAYTPRLTELGLAATIGKGDRSAEVCRAIRAFGSVYLCATGGAGALLSRHVTAARTVAFPELDCEAIRLLTVSELPLTVAVDCHGGNIFERRTV